MKTTNDRTPDQRQVFGLLQEAALLHVAAACFTYPDAATRETVARRLAEIPAAQGESPAALERELAATTERWNTGADESLEGEYVRLFLGAAQCSLHETSWGDGRRAGGRVVELADIAGFYRAFGFTLSPERRDLPDHLCAELEFLAALRIKEAWALAEGLEEALEVTRAATAEFLDLHLGRWPATLRDSLVAAGAADVYTAAANLVVAMVADTCRRAGVSPELADGRVEAGDDACVACPMAAAGEPG